MYVYEKPVRRVAWLLGFIDFRELLRTPQYHPELQPIENCWAVVKNHCAAKCTYTMAGLRAHLADGFEKVTPDTCRAALADMRSEEDRYWREDMEESEE